MKLKKILALSLAAAMALSLGACGNKSDSNADSGSNTAAQSDSTGGSGEGGTLKIGGIGPLTGDNAAYGIAVQRGAQIAVDESNAAGGINGMTVEFSMEDDVSDEETAVNAYNALKDWGMQMLLGTVTSAPCIAVVAETADDNMFQLTPSGTAVDAWEMRETLSGSASRIPARELFPRTILPRILWERKLALSTTAPIRIPPESTRVLRQRPSLWG